MMCALMGNPIKAAMWLARELKKDGITLKKGDLLSLGGFIPPQPAKPGMKVKLQYVGLPGDPARIAATRRQVPDRRAVFWRAD